MVAGFCKRLIDGQPLDICGDGEQKRDHLYAEEMATANRIAADIPLGAGVDARAFNAGTGEATSGNRLATLLEEIAGARPGPVCKDACAGELRRSVGHPRIPCARGWRGRSGISRPRGWRRTRPDIFGRSRQTVPLSVAVQIDHYVGDYHP